MSFLRRAYGSGPFHLMAVSACFVISGYAILRLERSDPPLQLFIWFGGAIIAHDLVLYPAYTLLDRAAARPRLRRRVGAEWINFMRIPVVLSGVVLLVWFPLILGLNDESYRAASGLSTDRFLGRWLLLTGVLFAASAGLCALRLVRRSFSEHMPAPR